MASKIKSSDVNKVLGFDLFKELGGKAFCMTGTMSVSRQHLESVINYCGGVNHASIKSNTFALLVPNGDDFRKGSKYQAALSKGIMIVTEREFCQMILPSIDELRGTNGSGASN